MERGSCGNNRKILCCDGYIPWSPDNKNIISDNGLKISINGRNQNVRPEQTLTINGGENIFFQSFDTNAGPILYIDAVPYELNLRTTNELSSYPVKNGESLIFQGLGSIDVKRRENIISIEGNESSWTLEIDNEKIKDIGSKSNLSFNSGRMLSISLDPKSGNALLFDVNLVAGDGIIFNTDENGNTVISTAGSPTSYNWNLGVDDEFNLIENGAEVNLVSGRFIDITRSNQGILFNVDLLAGNGIEFDTNEDGNNIISAISTSWNLGVDDDYQSIEDNESVNLKSGRLIEIDRVNDDIMFNVNLDAGDNISIDGNIISSNYNWNLGINNDKATQTILSGNRVNFIEGTMMNINRKGSEITFGVNLEQGSDIEFEQTGEGTTRINSTYKWNIQVNDEGDQLPVESGDTMRMIAGRLTNITRETNEIIVSSVLQEGTDISIDEESSQISSTYKWNLGVNNESDPIPMTSQSNLQFIEGSSINITRDDTAITISANINLEAGDDINITNNDDRQIISSTYGWSLGVNNENVEKIDSGANIQFLEGSNINITKDGTNITIGTNFEEGEDIEFIQKDGGTSINSTYGWRIGINNEETTSVLSGDQLVLSEGPQINISREGNDIIVSSNLVEGNDIEFVENESGETVINSTYGWNIGINNGETISVLSGDELILSEGSHINISREGNNITVASNFVEGNNIEFIEDESGETVINSTYEWSLGINNEEISKNVQSGTNIQFLGGSNINITRDGNDITIGTNFVEGNNIVFINNETGQTEINSTYGWSLGVNNEDVQSITSGTEMILSEGNNIDISRNGNEIIISSNLMQGDNIEFVQTETGKTQVNATYNWNIGINNDDTEEVTSGTDIIFLEGNLMKINKDGSEITISSNLVQGDAIEFIPNETGQIQVNSTYSWNLGVNNEEIIPMISGSELQIIGGNLVDVTRDDNQVTFDVNLIEGNDIEFVATEVGSVINSTYSWQIASNEGDAEEITSSDLVRIKQSGPISVTQDNKEITIGVNLTAGDGILLNEQNGTTVISSDPNAEYKWNLAINDSSESEMVESGTQVILRQNGLVNISRDNINKNIVDVGVDLINGDGIILQTDENNVTTISAEPYILNLGINTDDYVQAQSGTNLRLIENGLVNITRNGDDITIGVDLVQGDGINITNEGASTIISGTGLQFAINNEISQVIEPTSVLRLIQNGLVELNRNGDNITIGTNLVPGDNIQIVNEDGTNIISSNYNFALSSNDDEPETVLSGSTLKFIEGSFIEINRDGTDITIGSNLFPGDGITILNEEGRNVISSEVYNFALSINQDPSQNIVSGSTITLVEHGLTEISRDGNNITIGTNLIPGNNIEIVNQDGTNIISSNYNFELAINDHDDVETVLSGNTIRFIEDGIVKITRNESDITIGADLIAGENINITKNNGETVISNSYNWNLGINDELSESILSGSNITLVEDGLLSISKQGSNITLSVDIEQGNGIQISNEGGKHIISADEYFLNMGVNNQDSEQLLSGSEIQFIQGGLLNISRDGNNITMNVDLQAGDGIEINSQDGVHILSADQYVLSMGINNQESKLLESGSEIQFIQNGLVNITRDSNVIAIGVDLQAGNGVHINSENGTHIISSDTYSWSLGVNEDEYAPVLNESQIRFIENGLLKITKSGNELTWDVDLQAGPGINLTENETGATQISSFSWNLAVNDEEPIPDVTPYSVIRLNEGNLMSINRDINNITFDVGLTAGTGILFNHNSEDNVTKVELNPEYSYGWNLSVDQDEELPVPNKSTISIIAEDDITVKRSEYLSPNLPEETGLSVITIGQHPFTGVSVGLSVDQHFEDLQTHVISFDLFDEPFFSPVGNISMPNINAININQTGYYMITAGTQIDMFQRLSGDTFGAKVILADIRLTYSIQRKKSTDDDFYDIPGTKLVRAYKTRDQYNDQIYHISCENYSKAIQFFLTEGDILRLTVTTQPHTQGVTDRYDIHLMSYATHFGSHLLRTYP